MVSIYSRASSVGASDSFVALTRASSSRPRTATRPTTSGTSIASQDIVCAVSESRGVSATVGLAFVNLSTAEAVLCQICDNQTYVKTVTKIGVYEPTEILLMNSAQESKLAYILKENIPDTTFTSVDRKFWSETMGHEYVERLAFSEDVEPIKMVLEWNYFASCCFAAVLKYVEVELNKAFTCHSLRIKYEPSQGAMSIDLSTIVSLELTQNLQVARSKDSLFGLLNETLTPMGTRLLRANILQPSTDESQLLARYDAVEDLTTKEDMFVSIRQALKGYLDVDKALTALILVPTKRAIGYVEQSVNNVIMVKTYVSSIKSIYKALAPAQSNLLLNIRELCVPEGHQALEQLIDETLNEEVTYTTKPLDLRNQRIYCVRVKVLLRAPLSKLADHFDLQSGSQAGVNSLLDVARQAYKEANTDATELVTALAECHDLALDLKYDRARQYYISISTTETHTLPEVFINVYRKKNRIECQTLDLVKLNHKIRDAHNEVINMSDETVHDLITSICSEVSSLFKISEAIAILDMLASFAQLATSHEYIRPEITNVLAIKAGRHPIREKIHAKRFIPNDVYATPQTRFNVITGCNMSGKSTYIRSIALMTVMAQIGCFVPAEYASFPITHQLFARIATADDVEANVSTFAAEMREMAFILRNVLPEQPSMVIVDELGRGTSTADGLAIAIAIAEALVESHALVWFVTHFRDLAVVLGERSGVASLHLAAEISPDASKMTMLYRVAEGPDTTRFYGLALAKLVDLPPGVLETAQEVAENLDHMARRRHAKTRALAVTRKRNLILSLREQLLLARDGTLGNKALWRWLKRLQDEFLLRMAAIDGDAAESSGDNGAADDAEEDAEDDADDDGINDTEDDDTDEAEDDKGENPENQMDPEAPEDSLSWSE